MYLRLDGTGVPVRPAEVDGRRGKQPDGSAKTREVKLVTVWTAEGRDPQGRPRRDTGSVSYNAAVESAASRDTDPQPAAFAQRVHREAQRMFDTHAVFAFRPPGGPLAAGAVAKLERIAERHRSTDRWKGIDPWNNRWRGAWKDAGAGELVHPGRRST